MSEKIGRLATDLGERSTYDAASQCSRCGYCEQSCPTYVATGRESQSPRGRNQIVRLLLEGKLVDRPSARQALDTCLLCGGCATTCYAHVPTADVVLEGRRLLAQRPPLLVRALTRLLIGDPKTLALVLKAAFFFKRLGLGRLAARLGILKALGLGGLGLADAHVDEAPREFLLEALRRAPPVPDPSWLYFAACGTNYLYPRVGLATVEAVSFLLGPGAFPDNGCCGLLCYNYGEIADARLLARRTIADFEKSGADLPLVADCSSCVAFLKSYPQLFLEDAAWKGRAQRFAYRVQDAAEVYAGQAGRFGGAGAAAPTVYHDSCRARHGQGISAQKTCGELCGPSFRELAEPDVCCGGAGAFSFSQPELADEVLRRKIGAIAASQARLVATSSTSCLIQLAHGLKKYYPEGRVVHLSELAAAKIKK